MCVQRVQNEMIFANSQAATERNKSPEVEAIPGRLFETILCSYLEAAARSIRLVSHSYEFLYSASLLSAIWLRHKRIC